MTIESDEHWLSLVDAFQAAALGEMTWDAALKGLAEATGSRGSQLIGRKSDLSVLYNVMTNVDPEIQKQAIELQPINPRPPVVERAPILQLTADWDVITPEESKRNQFYQELLLPADAPFFCATVIERQKDLFVTLGLMRSRADGYITSKQRQTFGLLAPHVRAAIRLEAALEGKSAAMLAQCMETLSIPLFVCDALGRVKSLTHAAEHLVASGRGLHLTRNRLRAIRERETRALDDAIAAALPAVVTPGLPVVRTVVLHGPKANEPPIVLEVFPLPHVSATSITSFGPRILIVACGQRRMEARRTVLLSAVYHLTPAEIAIAHLLATGKSIEDIAVLRNASVGTVRIQTKSVLAKCGVRRQPELLALLNQL